MRDRCGLGAIVFRRRRSGLPPRLPPRLLLAWALEAASHDAKYPDIGGTWVRPGAAQWDPTKPAGLRQQAPLTAEYQAIFENNLNIAKAGGQEYNPQVNCLPAGMPRVMIAYDPLEFIVTPDVTYMRSDHLAQFRRIYTDGRPWPDEIKPSFVGYSIGRWVDPDAQGRYGALEVETRSPQGAALARRQRTALGHRQPDHRQGTDLSRPGQSQSYARPGHHHRSCLYEAVDRRAKLQPRSRSGLGREQLRRRQSLCLARQGNLLHQRGRLPDAHQEDQPEPGLQGFDQSPK